MPRMLRFTRMKTRWFYALLPYKATEGIFSLLFPLYLLNILQVQVGMAGLLTTLVSLTAVPGSMLWGYLSDRYHARRSLLVLGCLASVVCLAGMGLTASVWPMMGLCLAYGAFSIVLAPISSILVMETTPAWQWENGFGAISRIGAWGWAGGLVIAIAGLPLLGRWFAEEQTFRVAFLCLAGGILLCAWWLWRTIPEPVHRIRRQAFIEVTRRLPTLTSIERALYLPQRLLFVLQPAHLMHLPSLVDRPMRLYMLATAIMFFSFTMAMTLFPLFLQTTFDMNTPSIFALMLVRALASIPFYERAGLWAQRMGVKRVQSLALIGRFGVFLGCCSLWWFSHPLVVAGVLVVVNALTGMTWSMIAVTGPVIVGRLASPKRKGEAMGVYNAIQGASQIIGPVFAGYLTQWTNYYSVFALAAVLLLPALVILVGLRVPGPVTPSPPVRSTVGRQEPVSQGARPLAST